MAESVGEGDAANPVAAIAAALVRSGLVDSDLTVRLSALTGGVSSDIWKVEVDGRVFVVKRALAKLRVAQDWRAPVSRNAAEAAWLRTAGAVVPGAVPRVLREDAATGLFAMDYLPPETHPVWKALLMQGVADAGFAAAVGATLARLHSATDGDPAVAAAFANAGTFHQIRLEPYLEATASRHPALAEALMGLSHRTDAHRAALIHGDVSPKNILVGPAGPVFLDAECATYGDPAFDLAFCLNHLLLKCLVRPEAAAGYLAAFDALAGSFLAGVAFEPPEALEARAAALLPALFLARVDGKSPVEYLVDDASRERVRAAAVPLVRTPPARLEAVRRHWAAALEGTS